MATRRSKRRRIAPIDSDAQLMITPSSPTDAQPSSQQSNKSLDVSEALSYLDLVKKQLESQPRTYNRFLDLMGDSKKGNIDTTGVIERASVLFQGYPRLLQGFNTFLPPGYLIKYSEESNTITVITPHGETTTNGHSTSQPMIEVDMMESQSPLPMPSPIPVPAISSSWMQESSISPSIVPAMTNSLPNSTLESPAPLHPAGDMAPPSVHLRWNPEEFISSQTSLTSTKHRIYDNSAYIEGEYDFLSLHLELIESRRRSQLSNGPPPTQQKPKAPAVSERIDESTIVDANVGQKRKRTDTSLAEIQALDWTDFIFATSQFLGSGGYGDVYEGEWRNLPPEPKSTQPPLVVLKKFKVAPSLTPGLRGKTTMAILREIAVWHKLDHKNVVPFVGICYLPGSIPCLVSEYIYNGPIKEWILQTPSACLFQMICGVINGLHYLHCEQLKAIIHGDLKADNVLVNRSGQPTLCDFGLSRVLEDNSLWNTSATHATGTLRWMSPELLNASQESVTLHSDIYAYAMTCYEIFTGLLPFHNLKNDALVLTAVVLKNSRPGRPVCSITDEIWDMMETCWTSDPTERPLSARVIEILGPHDCERDNKTCIFRDPSA